jgi:hypothetical protein
MLEWSRWAPLTLSSPSGKQMFVCLVCGSQTPAPSKDCTPLEDFGRNDGVRLFGMSLKTCRAVEERVQMLSRHTPADRRIAYAENRLREGRKQYCENCFGYGCNYCFGTGYRWSTGW